MGLGAYEIALEVTKWHVKFHEMGSEELDVWSAPLNQTYGLLLYIPLKPILALLNTQAIDKSEPFKIRIKLVQMEYVLTSNDSGAQVNVTVCSVPFAEDAWGVAPEDDRTGVSLLGDRRRQADIAALRHKEPLFT